MSGQGSYVIQKLDKPDAPRLIFHSSDPPSCSGHATTDLQYLIQSVSPVPHPLQNALGIQLYNKHWFDPSITPLMQHPCLPSTDDEMPSDPNCIPKNSTVLPIELATTLDNDLSISASLPIVSPDMPDHPFLLPTLSSTSFHDSIQQSHDHLFFICYTPASMFCPCWILNCADGGIH